MVSPCLPWDFSKTSGVLRDPACPREILLRLGVGSGLSHRTHLAAVQLGLSHTPLTCGQQFALSCQPQTDRTWRGP